MALDRASYNQGQNAQFDIGISEDGISQTVVAKGPGAVCYGICSYDSNSMKSSNPESGFYEADTSRTLDNNGGNPCCNQGGMAVVQTVAIEGNGSRPSHKGDGYAETDKSYTLNATEVHGVAYGFDPGATRDAGALFIEDKAKTLAPGSCPGWHDGVVSALDDSKSKIKYIVRRLTPMECERLQGFPDLWTDIGDYTDTKGKARKCSDAVRYKALGNSIALPSWRWLLGRLCGNYDRPATMASLFDGIGGFPLIWEEINGKGTAVWASEIEDFPIAVTKERIGE